MKKINFKQPKYVIPALAFLPLIWLGWNIIGMIDFEVEEEKVVQTEGAINTDMPDANLKGDIKSKYQAMVDELGKVKDHAAVQNLNDEPEKAKDGIQESLYNEEEIKLLDSLEEEKKKSLEMLQQLQNDINVSRNSPQEKKKENENLEEDLQKQLELLQKIANGDTKTPEQIEEEKKREEEEKERRRKREEEVIENAPKEVLKANGENQSHFNTIGKEEKDSQLIKAMVDEEIKVTDGSRIRLRLLDDIILDNILIKKGEYIYAIVNGFSAQRIKAQVNSILVNNQHKKVELSIFDNDGIEGLFVPESQFRDLAKEAASSSLGQSINMNNQTGEQNLESFAFQTLQNVYQSATSAISNNIKKNKAKIKYNTVVYLINNK